MVVIYITVKQNGESFGGNDGLYIKARLVDSDRSLWLHGNVQLDTSLSAGPHNVGMCLCVHLSERNHLTVYPCAPSSRFALFTGMC